MINNIELAMSKSKIEHIIQWFECQCLYKYSTEVNLTGLHFLPISVAARGCVLYTTTYSNIKHTKLQ